LYSCRKNYVLKHNFLAERIQVIKKKIIFASLNKLFTMKKLLVLSFVAGLLVLASCGGGNQTAPAADTTKNVVEKPAADTMHKAAADTTKK
jgi:hypothetical protein